MNTLKESKVYLVTKYGGEFEDKWSVPVGVCSTPELAKQLKAEIIKSEEHKYNISDEEFAEMLQTLEDYEDEHNMIFKSDEEGLQKLFPDKDPNDIEIACTKFFSYDDFVGVHITELTYYSTCN